MQTKKNILFHGEEKAYKNGQKRTKTDAVLIHLKKIKFIKSGIIYANQKR